MPYSPYPFQERKRSGKGNGNGRSLKGDKGNMGREWRASKVESD